MKHLFKSFLVFFLFLCACGKDISNKQAFGNLQQAQIASSDPNSKSSTSTPQPSWVPDQLLVQFNQAPWAAIPGDETVPVSQLQFTDKEIKSIFEKYGVEKVHLQVDVEKVLKSAQDKYPPNAYQSLVKGFQTLHHRYLLYLKDVSQLDDLKKALDDSDFVKKTSYNYYSFPDVTPNDPRYSEQWALNATHMNAEGAWDIRTDASGVRVGVIDGGFQANHEDLMGNISGTWGVGGSAVLSGVDACDGHGTHVAGIIGARGNNSLGVSGVAWRASLYLYRKGILNMLTGGCTSTVANYENAANAAISSGVRIINHSWTLCSSNSDGSQNWITDHIAAHQGTVLLVNAAMNDNHNLDSSHEADCVNGLGNVLLVANSDTTGARYPTSNWGHTTVHLAAPGSTKMGSSLWLTS